MKNSYNWNPAGKTIVSKPKAKRAAASGIAKRSSRRSDRVAGKTKA
jgi:hypothetical protein